MGKPMLSDTNISTIRSLRSSGLSVKEIVKELRLGTGTVSKYCKGVILTEKAKNILEEKRFPAKRKSQEEKARALFHAQRIIKKLKKRDIFLILVALYWGEGTKKELNLINGDPDMINFFIKGLLSLGIEKEKIKISIRVYSGQNKNSLTSFWLKKLALSQGNVVGFEMVDSGTKQNKLQYGMCRVRVEKSSYSHKLVTSAIKIFSSGSSIG